MHTVTNASKGRHQVKTLDQGLVFMDPGDVLTAELEPSYARVVGRAMHLHVGNAAEGAVPGLARAEPTQAPETSAEGQQNGSSEPDSEPTDRAGWVKLAQSKGITVKSGWSINQIKSKIEAA